MNQPQSRLDEAQTTKRQTAQSPVPHSPLIGGHGLPLTLSPTAVSPSHLVTLSPCHPGCYESTYLQKIVSTVNEAFPTQSWPYRFAKSRENPYAFARDILGSTWWRMQREVAESVVNHRRIVVKSANGVGKTFLAAD